MPGLRLIIARFYIIKNLPHCAQETAITNIQELIFKLTNNGWMCWRWCRREC